MDPTHDTETEVATATPKTDLLFPEQERIEFRQRWDAVQAESVDDPRNAVQRADALVADTM